MNLPLPFRHILGLSVLAIAQPLFDILSRHSQFFVTSNSSSGQILAMVVVVMLVPALVLLLLQRLLRIAGMGQAGERVILLLLLGLVAARLANQLGVNSILAFGALITVLAIGFSLVYWRWPSARSFVDFLAVAVVVVPAVFLYQLLYAGPLGELNRNLSNDRLHVTAPAPVVFVIIDEVPTTSLQQADGRIDAARFPNFARLAGAANWYRNATTVADSTEVAIPALLTGLRPDPAWTNPTASASRHPRNLFTALAGHYSVNAFEPVTALCPPSVCFSSRRTGGAPWRQLLEDVGVVYAHLVVPPTLRSRLPSVDQYWSGFFNKGHDSHLKAATASPRAQFLESLSQVQPNSLNFVHIYLPHVPWRYLPSGQVYASHPRDYRIEGFDPGAAVNVWLDDPTAIALAYQRHILQLAYVDTWLGSLLDKLQAQGLWDQALVILVADHGVSFKSGEPRRWVTDGNLEDIAPVPLLIKYPGQVQGAVIDRSVETIDLLPTIFRELAINSDWSFDGIALQDVEVEPERKEKLLVVKQRGEEGVSFVQKQLASDYYLRSHTLAFRHDILGLPVSEQGLFDVSVDRSMLGAQVASLAAVAGDKQVHIKRAATISRFQRGKNRLLPAYIQGQLVTESEPGAQIAVALNGTIRAVTRTFSALPPGRFAVILPEQYFEDTGNHVDFFEVVPGDVTALRRMAVIDLND